MEGESEITDALMSEDARDVILKVDTALLLLKSELCPVCAIFCVVFHDTAD